MTAADMTDTDRVPDERAVEAATYGLRFEAGNLGLRWLTDEQAAQLARVALVHALGSSYVLTHDRHARILDAEQRHTRTALTRASAAEVARDAMLVRAQHAATARNDQALADELGVMLPPKAPV